MPSQPQLGLESVAANAAGWDASVNNNFTQIQRHLLERPTQLRAVCRQVSNRDPFTTLYLGDFDPTQYAYHLGFVVDSSGDANDPSSGFKQCYSDGTNWRYTENDQLVDIV